MIEDKTECNPSVLTTVSTVVNRNARLHSRTSHTRRKAKGGALSASISETSDEHYVHRTGERRRACFDTD